MDVLALSDNIDIAERLGGTVMGTDVNRGIAIPQPDMELPSG